MGKKRLPPKAGGRSTRPKRGRRGTEPAQASGPNWFVLGSIGGGVVVLLFATVIWAFSGSPEDPANDEATANTSGSEPSDSSSGTDLDAYVERLRGVTGAMVEPIASEDFEVDLGVHGDLVMVDVPRKWVVADGSIESRFFDALDPGIPLMVRVTGITAKGAGQLAGLDQVVGLNVSGTRFDEAALAALANGPNLAGLVLIGTTLEDGSLDALPPGLRWLSVDDTDRGTPTGNALLSDASLDALQRLEDLWKLEFTAIGISNDGVAKLQSLKNLTTLHIHEMPDLTDDCLAHVAAMPKLTRFDAHGGGITVDGLRSLQQTRSDTRITSGFREID